MIWATRRTGIAAAMLLAGGCAIAAAPSPPAPPKAYLIAEVAVTDADAYRRYASSAGPVITACGGTYLARGGQVEGLEGPPPEARFVIVAFASLAAARDCYHSPAYQALAPIRRAASRSRFWLAEGLPQ
jgi:uncharacterized protein (DUF1330 family)